MIPQHPESTAAEGAAIHALVAELYPICRTLAGPGVRQTLEVLKQYIPLNIESVSSGTRVFDWVVPPEWHIREAWIKDASGHRVIDFAECNLHVVNFSQHVRATLSLGELRPHLHTAAADRRWVPYRTSYYDETWGFCLSEEQLAKFTESEYQVYIDAEHVPGVLNYGELFLPGNSTDEVLFSCHVCHPSLANDNLSGIAIATWLARHLALIPRRYSYRFLFVPATLGPLCWLARNPEAQKRVKHGLVLTLLGDSGPSNYKRSRAGKGSSTGQLSWCLRHSGQWYGITDYSPIGYDERQYCARALICPWGVLCERRMDNSHNIIPPPIISISCSPSFWTIHIINFSLRSRCWSIIGAT